MRFKFLQSDDSIVEILFESLVVLVLLLLKKQECSNCGTYCDNSSQHSNNPSVRIVVSSHIAYLRKIILGENIVILYQY